MQVRATAAANISPATNPNSEIQSDLFMIAKPPLVLDPHLFTANKADMRTHRFLATDCYTGPLLFDIYSN